MLQVQVPGRSIQVGGESSNTGEGQLVGKKGLLL